MREKKKEGNTKKVSQKRMARTVPVAKRTRKLGIMSLQFFFDPTL